MKPYILHYYSNNIPFTPTPKKVDKRITVFTVADKLNYNNSYLRNQVNLLNVEEDFVYDSHIKKLIFTQQLLNKIDTEYALYLDCIDTVILRDLDQSFIDCFKDYDIVFCGEPNPSNGYESNEWLSRDKLINNSNIELSLNTGIIFGKTQDLRDLYNYVITFNLNRAECSDQNIIKQVLATFNKKVAISNIIPAVNSYYYDNDKLIKNPIKEIKEADNFTNWFRNRGFIYLDKKEFVQTTKPAFVVNNNLNLEFAKNIINYYSKSNKRRNTLIMVIESNFNRFEDLLEITKPVQFKLFFQNKLDEEYFNYNYKTNLNNLFLWEFGYRKIFYKENDLYSIRFSSFEEMLNSNICSCRVINSNKPCRNKLCKDCKNCPILPFSLL